MNSVNLIGRLTGDPEARTTSTGKTVATMRLAIQRKPGRGGEDKGAVFVDVAAWDRLGEVCTEHLSRGRTVAVSGRLEHEEWTAEDGTKRQRHKVVADEVLFIGPNSRSEKPAPDKEA